MHQSFNLLEMWQTIINQALQKNLPAKDSILHEAMHYCALNGGKRIRGMLVYAGALCVNKEIESIQQNINLSYLSCALECIHAYSLIHDDLPCMDNDDLRRGKPTCHKVYGEALALLAGDALQAHAFNLLSQSNLPTIYEVLAYLSKASGSLGMVGGQSIDMLANQKQAEFNLANLQYMHNLKTGALIDASFCIGILALDKNYYIKNLSQIKQLTQTIGLGFQIVDDILDVTQNTITLGKTAGKDNAQNKCSYVTILGLEVAKQQAYNLHQKAIEIVDNISNCNNNLLIEIIHMIFARNF